MSVARRLAAALAVLGAGVLAYAVPASATDGNTAPAAGAGCVDATVKSNLEWGIDPKNGSAWVKATGPVCADVEFILSLYDVPETWDGSAFPGGTAPGSKPGEGLAVPQAAVAHKTGWLVKKDAVPRKLWLSLPLPDCGNVQIDLYLGRPLGRPIETVDANGHPANRLLAGLLGSIGGPNGQPKECEETPTPPVTPSGTPSPTPTTPTATPTPPAATPTTPPPPTTAPPTEGLGAPIPVTPPAVRTPPVLAQTGSDSTVPLVGLGMLLLAAGVGLSLVGRRRSA